MSPVTDNAPFFFFTLKLGQTLHPQSLQRGVDWKNNLGVAVLGMVLAISLLAVLVFLVLPLARGVRGHQPRPVRLLYFIAVGLGYILVEIAFIQRFVLFLGHPVYALTVVVFLLLLSSGAGSMVSRWWLAETSRIWLPLFLIAAAVLLYVGVLPGLLGRLVGLPFIVKLLVSAGLLVPLGFAMGMPFPTGLRALAGRSSSELPPADSPGQPRGMGLGDECRIERPGFGFGHYHRYPVRTECHPGIRSCRLSCGSPADYNASPGAESRLNRIAVCYDSGLSRINFARENACLARSS